jgi:hypothetical protein
MLTVHACIDSTVEIANESPFICVFRMRAQNDDVIGALIGPLARSFYKILRIGDVVEVSGRFIDGMHLGYTKVFAISKINMPKAAATGRNINLWG